MKLKMNDEIKNIIQEILNKLTIQFENIDILKQDERYIFMINTKEANQLIGVDGVNLLALNHIIKRVANKKNTNENNFYNFTVDINHYQLKKNEEIENRTKIIKERVISFHMDIEMEPMSSYERMLVHSILTEDDNVETQSIGFGKDRRVVVKFKK